jgi:hypothetical protein
MEQNMSKSSSKKVNIIGLIMDEVGGGSGNNSNIRANIKAIYDIHTKKSSVEKKSETKEAIAESTTPIVMKEFNTKDTDALNKFLAENQDKKNILISAGDVGVMALQAVTDENVVKVVISHQVTDKIKAAKNIDITAISRHAISHAQELELTRGGRQLVKLIGASSTLTQEQIETNYKALHDHFPNDKPIFGVLFGGDASMPDGSMKVLTIENAEVIGKKIAFDAHFAGAIIKITDGPRAGAHLGRKDGELNPVMNALINSIKANYTGVDIEYFPFIHDKAKREAMPSAYRAILGGANKIYYTMESISAGFELSILPSLIGKGVAIESESTLPEHKAFAEDLYRQGYIGISVSKNETFIDMPKQVIPSSSIDPNYNALALMRGIEKYINRGPTSSLGA